MSSRLLLDSIPYLSYFLLSLAPNPSPLSLRTPAAFFYSASFLPLYLLLLFITTVFRDSTRTVSCWQTSPSSPHLALACLHMLGPVREGGLFCVGTTPSAVPSLLLRAPRSRVARYQTRRVMFGGSPIRQTSPGSIDAKEMSRSCRIDATHTRDMTQTLHPDNKEHTAHGCIGKHA